MSARGQMQVLTASLRRSELPQHKLSTYGLRAVGEGTPLTYDEARDFALTVLQLPDETRSAQLGLLLGGLMASRPSVDIASGVIDAVFEYEGFNPLTQAADGGGVVGVAGSGKKSWKTANITTAASIVAAAAGVRIAKAVSGATSSVCGSADMFRMLGSSLSRDTSVALEQMEETGLGVFEIEGIIPRFDLIYGGLFHAPHVLSLALPALLIPVRVDSFCYGLAHPATGISREVIARYRPGEVVTVASQLPESRWIDELTSIGSNIVSRASSAPHPAADPLALAELLGRPSPNGEAMLDIASASNPRDQTELMRSVLTGRANMELLRTVALNAGLLIELAGNCTFEEGFRIAMSVLTDGAAMDTLQRYIRLGSAAGSKIY